MDSILKQLTKGSGRKGGKKGKKARKPRVNGPAKTKARKQARTAADNRRKATAARRLDIMAKADADVPAGRFHGTPTRKLARTVLRFMAQADKAQAQAEVQA